MDTVVQLGFVTKPSSYSANEASLNEAYVHSCMITLSIH